jgi:hypothetical protein
MEIRGVFLGAAASVAALTGAQAADLPVKAKPVEYVKICSLYGAAFYYIPGTDTCIRVGGQLRAEVSIGSRGSGYQQWSTDGSGNNTRTRDRDIFFTRSRSVLNIDTRTQTSFGTLRTFSLINFEVNTPTGIAGTTTVLGVWSSMIQWGGFTIGRAGASYFDNPWKYSFQWGNTWWGNPDTAGGAPFVVAYTHQFGNGISGTLSLEDMKLYNRPIYNGTNALSIIGAPLAVNTLGGNTWPQIVGQLRIDQAWGGFHLAGEILNNHVAYNCGGASSATCSELSGSVSDKLGGGVNAAFKFNVPTGVNDALYVGGSWSVGDTNAVVNAFTSPAFGLYGGTNSPNVYGSITGSYVWNSVYTTTARTGAGITVGPVGQQLTRAYGGSIAFEHGWNAEWRTSIFGGVQIVDYNETANAILCSRFGAGSTSGQLVNLAGANVSNTSACNWDYRLAGVGSRTYWTPVKDLTIGLEVVWTNHHVSHDSGTVYLQPVVSGFKPNAAYEIKDQNVVSGMFSVRRFF